jgi:hypothetical protein
LLSRDGRAGEDYGLENTHSLLLESEVSLPINIDDTDIYPEIQKLPATKVGWTAMTFSLINIDLSKTMQKLASITASSTPSSPLSENTRAQIIGETRARMEKLLELCNPVIPRNQMTLLCSRFLLRKLDFITRLQWSLLRRSGPHNDFVTEQNLIEALEILEPKLQSEDALLEQFSWVRKAYPQYHVGMYVLWHLCVKPIGPSVNRAWAAIETLFSNELRDESTVGFGSKSAVLTALKAKALSVRETSRKVDTGRNVRNDDGDSGLMSGEGSAETGGFSTYLFADTGADENGLESGIDEWPNWATLVQSFQFDSPDVFFQ